MAEQAISRGTLRVWDPGRTYEPLGGAFGAFTRLKDELNREKIKQGENDPSQFEQRMVTIKELTADQTGIYGATGSYVPAGIMYEDVDWSAMYLCRPLVDQTQRIDYTRYRYWRNSEETNCIYVGLPQDEVEYPLNWAFIQLPGEWEGQCPIIFSYPLQETTGSTEPVDEGEEEEETQEVTTEAKLPAVGQARTTFYMPPDPHIILNLWMGAFPSQVDDEQGMYWKANPPRLEILFGGRRDDNDEDAAFCLMYSETGASFWWYNDSAGQWQLQTSESGAIPMPAKGSTALPGLMDWIHIGRVGDHIVIANNNEYRGGAAYRLPMAAEDPYRAGIKTGRFGINGIGVPFMWSLFATKMIDAWVKSPLYSPGYDLVQSGAVYDEAAGEEPTDADNPFRYSTWGLSVQQRDPTTGLPQHIWKQTKIELERNEVAGVPGNQIRWKATLEPLMWFCRTYGVRTTNDQSAEEAPDDAVAVNMWTCPQLASVNFWQFMKFEVKARGHTDVQMDTKGYQGTLQRSSGSDWGFWLDNRLSQHVDFQDGTCLQLYIGDEPGPYSTLMATTYAVSASPDLEAGVLEVHAVDGYTQLSSAKNFGFWPCFDGWRVNDVIRFLAGYAYLGAYWKYPEDIYPSLTDVYNYLQLALEDVTPENGTWYSKGGIGYVPAGRPEDQKLMPQKNDTVMATIQQAVKIASGAEVWFSPAGVLSTGCPFCRTQRTNTTFLQHNGTRLTTPTMSMWPSLCDSTVTRHFWTNYSVRPLPILDGFVHRIYAPRETVAPGVDFANRIQVSCKRSEDDMGIIINYVDYGSLHKTDSRKYLGYPVDAAETFDPANTYETLAQHAVMRIWELTNPAEFVEIVTPMDEALSVGQTIQVWGATELGMNEKYFRIETIRPSWNLSSGENPRMMISAKRIIEDSDVLAGGYV